MNREQRRHPEKLEQLEQPNSRHERPQDSNPSISPEDRMRGDDRTPDDLDPRAKSSGHGKKTADKWNQ